MILSPIWYEWEYRVCSTPGSHLSKGGHVTFCSVDVSGLILWPTAACRLGSTLLRMSSLSKKWPLRHDDGSRPRPSSSFPSYFGGFLCARLPPVSSEEEEAAIAATLYDVWSREAFLWDPIMPPLPRAAATAARPHHGHRACGAAAGFPTMLLRSPILPPLVTISLTHRRPSRSRTEPYRALGHGYRSKAQPTSDDAQRVIS